MSNLPPLYGSKPNDPSARKIGSYIMWVAIAGTCVTSSMFMTGLAPNVLAIEVVRKTVNVELEWMTWFIAFIPAGLILLAAVPFLAYKLYPPEVKEGPEVSQWAAGELARMGSLTKNEILLLVYVMIALLLWVFGADLMNATTAALVVIALMLITGVIKWSDMTSYKDAWNTLAWFATLVALADGLARVGFIKWFAEAVGAHLGGMSPVMAIIVLALVNHFMHYLFASVTAHVTAMLPVLLAVGAAIPGMPVEKMALLLCLQLGIMGIITPYGTGPSPVYYGSGFLPSKDWWRLGMIFGLIYLVTYLVIVVPWVMAR
jgi:L-tartrate/succinate antiporter